MDKNLILAGSFAAAVHGLVLGWPRATATPHPHAIASPVPLADPLVPAIELTKADDPPVDAAIETTGGAPDATPRAIEPPPTDCGNWPKVPVEPFRPTRIDPNIRTVPAISGDPRGSIAKGDRPGPVSFATLDRAPRTRVQVSPDYPYEARRASLSGSVTVEFVVDESGRVVAPTVMSSSDHVFDAAALRAVSKWRFEPGTVHGHVVRFRMALPLVFRLET